MEFDGTSRIELCYDWRPATEAEVDGWGCDHKLVGETISSTNAGGLGRIVEFVGRDGEPSATLAVRRDWASSRECKIGTLRSIIRHPLLESLLSRD